MSATAELVGGDFDGLVRKVDPKDRPEHIAVNAGFYTHRLGRLGWKRYTVIYRLEYIRDNDGDPHMVYVIDNDRR